MYSAGIKNVKLKKQDKRQKTMIPISVKNKQILRRICKEEQKTYNKLIEDMIAQYSFNSGKKIAEAVRNNYGGGI